MVPAGETAAGCAPLPIAALRLPANTVAGLSRLGFDRIEQLMTRPGRRSPCGLAAPCIRRLDQALGRVFEPIEPVVPPETVAARLAFPEPLLTPEALSGVIARLSGLVCAELERRGQGARRLDLTFERVDRTRQSDLHRHGAAQPPSPPISPGCSTSSSSGSIRASASRPCASPCRWPNR